MVERSCFLREEWAVEFTYNFLLKPAAYCLLGSLWTGKLRKIVFTVSKVEQGSHYVGQSFVTSEVMVGSVYCEPGGGRGPCTTK